MEHWNKNQKTKQWHCFLKSDSKLAINNHIKKNNRCPRLPRREIKRREGIKKTYEAWIKQEATSIRSKYILLSFGTLLTKVTNCDTINS